MGISDIYYIPEFFLVPKKHRPAVILTVTKRLRNFK